MTLMAFAAVLLPGRSEGAGAEWAALEALNKRNIFFGEVEYVEAVERGDTEVVRIFLGDLHIFSTGCRYIIHNLHGVGDITGFSFIFEMILCHRRLDSGIAFDDFKCDWYGRHWIAV